MPTIRVKFERIVTATSADDARQKIEPTVARLAGVAIGNVRKIFDPPMPHNFRVEVSYDKETE